MSKVIETIDRRIAKFSTFKDLKLKATPSSKDLRSVKLDPLSFQKISEKDSIQGPSSVSNMHLKNKLKSVKTRKSIEVTKQQAKNKRSIIKVQNKSLVTEEYNHLNELEELVSTQPLPQLIQIDEKEDIIEKFYKIIAKFRSLKAKSIFNSHHWTLYLIWNRNLNRGLKSIVRRWKRKKLNEKFIRGWIAGKVSAARFNHQVYCANRIKRFWKNVYRVRKYFHAAQTIARNLNGLARERYRKKVESAIVVQKNVRRFLVFKKFRSVLEEKKTIRKHQDMLKRQSLLVKNRNFKKNAVRVIEQFWLEYKDKLKNREMRKYLSTLPYECRQLYLKFKQVKKDADSLKNDVDAMIARKMEKISNPH